MYPNLNSDLITTNTLVNKTIKKVYSYKLTNSSSFTVNCGDDAGEKSRFTIIAISMGGWSSKNMGFALIGFWRFDASHCACNILINTIDSAFYISSANVSNINEIDVTLNQSASYIEYDIVNTMII